MASTFDILSHSYNFHHFSVIFPSFTIFHIYICNFCCYFTFPPSSLSLCTHSIFFQQLFLSTFYFIIILHYNYNPSTVPSSLSFLLCFSVLSKYLLFSPYILLKFLPKSSSTVFFYLSHMSHPPFPFHLVLGFFKNIPLKGLCICIITSFFVWMLFCPSCLLSFFSVSPFFCHHYLPYSFSYSFFNP